MTTTIDTADYTTTANPSIARAYRVMAGLPLPLRRRAVRTMFALKHPRMARRGAGPDNVHLFQRVLRLSWREARHLEREAALHDLAAEVEWYAIRARSLDGIRADAARTRLSDPDLMARVAQTGRPVIFAPMHMGAYVLGNCHLMLRYFPDRPMVILRQRDDMAMETSVLERIREFGIDMRFLQVTERKAFLSAVRFAQETSAVLVVFCDLAPRYGAPAPMPMFGLQTSFAFGVETLARLTGATVVPWASTMGPDGDTIRLGRPFEITGNSPEERAHAAGLMRGHIHQALRERPEQWHLWSMLDEYLPARGSVGNDEPETASERSRQAA